MTPTASDGSNPGPCTTRARPLVSIFIGGAAPTIIPSFLKGLARRAERIGGGE